MMNRRQLSLYEPVQSKQAKTVWQRIAEAEQQATVRLYADVIARAARVLERGGERTDESEECE